MQAEQGFQNRAENWECAGEYNLCTLCCTLQQIRFKWRRVGATGLDGQQSYSPESSVSDENGSWLAEPPPSNTRMWLGGWPFWLLSRNGTWKGGLAGRRIESLGRARR